MITIKQLGYALAVKKTRHFKQAADYCSVSQSALSSAISELESKLGLQIFERNNKKVLITPVGELVLEQASGIHQQVDALYQIASRQNEALAHPISIGVIPTIGPYLLPKVLPKLRAKYPDFKLSIIEEQSHLLVDKVRSGELDIAILALPYPISGLLAFQFWQEDFYIVTHRDCDLGSQEDSTSAALQDVRLLLLKDGHCLKDHALAACQLDQEDLNLSLEGTSLNTLVQMAAGKMGTTLVPEMALDQLVHESSELVAIPLGDPGPHRRIAIIARLNYSSVNSVEVLCELFKEELSKRSYIPEE